MTHAHAKRDNHDMKSEGFAGHESEHHLPHPTAKTPSWFSHEPLEPAEEPRASTAAEPAAPQPYFETPNTEAYEAYRRHLEMRFREAQKIYDVPKASAPVAPQMAGPSSRRPTMPVHEIAGRKRLYELEQASQPQIPPQRKASSFPLARMAMFGTAAICVGTIAGLGVSNFDLIKQKTYSSIGMLQHNLTLFDTKAAPAPVSVASASAGQETVIVKKSVATATLDVNDVRGGLNSMIPLMLNAQSADAAEPISLKISGLPPSAYLTAGVQTAQGSWTLKQSDIPGVKLVVPQSDAKQFDVEVAAVEDRTGSLAAPIKALNVQLDGQPQVAAAAPAASIATSAPTETGAGKVDAGSITDTAMVTPVSALPDTAEIKLSLPSAIPAANSEAKDLVAKGNVLLESGDIISARQFYMRAAELGEPQGSFGVGRSYDPQIFAKLNVVGLKPDAALAAQWYKKAADAGVVAASQ